MIIFTSLLRCLFNFGCHTIVENRVKILIYILLKCNKSKIKNQNYRRFFVNGYSYTAKNPNEPNTRLDWKYLYWNEYMLCVIYMYFGPRRLILEHIRENRHRCPNKTSNKWTIIKKSHLINMVTLKYRVNVRFEIVTKLSKVTNLQKKFCSIHKITRVEY